MLTGLHYVIGILRALVESYVSFYLSRKKMTNEDEDGIIGELLFPSETTEF